MRGPTCTVWAACFTRCSRGCPRSPAPHPAPSSALDWSPTRRPYARSGPKVSEGLGNVVAKALSREPEQRFANAAELGSALADPSSVPAVRLVAVGAGRTPRTWVVLGLLAAAVIAGVLLARRTRPARPLVPPGAMSLAVLPFRV